MAKPYWTEAEVRNLTGLSETDLTDAKMLTAGTITDNYIDGKLALAYNLPFTTNPPLVSSVGDWMCSALCYMTAFHQASPNKDTYGVMLFRESQRRVQEIVDGKIELIDSSGNVVARRTDTVEHVTFNTETEYDDTEMDDSAFGMHDLGELND